MALSVWTNAQILAQLDSSTYWGMSTITFSSTSTAGLVAYPTNDPYEYPIAASTYTAANGNQANAASLAISLWDSVMPQSFVAVNEAAGTNANIDLAGFYDASQTATYAYTMPNYAQNAYTGGWNITKATVWLNNAYGASEGSNNLVTPTIGDYGFSTVIHELGHALGLSHMGNYNGSAGSGPSCFQDSLVYSIMSYYGPNSALGGLDLGVAWADWGSYDPQTPMLNDILAIQNAYGVPTDTRTGNTTYGFNSNVSGPESAIYNFSFNAHPILCIFDSAGSDTLDLSGYSTSSHIDLHPGAFSNCNGMNYNISIAYSCTIENATGGSGDDVILGNNAGDTLLGGAGADNILGGTGNDTIAGGTGADILNGGSGINILHYYSSDVGVIVNLQTAGTSGGEAQGDVISNFQSIYGSNTGADLLVGNDSNNTLAGFGGNDQIFSGGGNDYLLGGDGNDIISGGVGADYSNGGTGTNTLHYYSSTAGVSVNLSANSASGGDAQGDTILNFQNIYGSNTGNDLLVGNAAANTLMGYGGDDQLFGGYGGDYIRGGDGNDTVSGGAGADNLDGGNGINTLHYYSSSAGVTINLFISSGVGGDAQGDTLFNFQNIYGANAAGDVLVGNNTVNALYGFGGNDYIAGYGGNDILSGGAGNDNFGYSASSFGKDVITDFTIGQDHLQISKALAASFSALTISQSGANTLITIGSDTITLNNIQSANLHVSDFIFY